MSDDRFDAVLRRGLRVAPPVRRRRRVVAPEPLRAAVVALLFVVVAAGAVAVGGRLAQLRAVVASPPATPAVAPATAPQRSAQVDARYGIVVATRDSLLVRRETDGHLVHELPLYTRAVAPYALSPEGRYVAYWARIGDSAQDYDLRVYDAAADRERVVLRERSALYLPSSVAWASDETGLAYGVAALVPRRDELARPPELRTVDLASGQVRTLYRGEQEGTTLVPLVWDREQQLVGVVRLGPRQTPERYLRVAESGRETKVDPQPMDEGTHVLTDAIGDPARGMVAGIDHYTCAGGGACTQLRVWPVERQFATGGGTVSQPGTRIAALRFIAGSRWVLVLTAVPGEGSERLEVLDPVGRRLPAVLRTYAGAQADRQIFVRPDGAAAYMFERTTGWSGELVELDGGAAHPVPAWDMGGRPVAVVTLDAAEAARVRALPVPAHLFTRDEMAAAIPTYADVHVDRTELALVTGTPPAGVEVRPIGDVVPPAWIIVRTGEFTWQGTFGPTDKGPNQPCQIWTFDARTGSASAYALGDLSLCEGYLRSAPFAPSR